MAGEKKFLKVLLALLESPEKRLSEEELKATLGNPSRAAWFRNRKTLTDGDFPILKETTLGEFRHYHLRGNLHDLVGLNKEETFIFQAYKRLGNLLEKNVMELPFQVDEEVNKKEQSELTRKFFYLSPIRARPYSSKGKRILKILMNSLLNNRIIFLWHSSNSPDSKRRKIKPFTICQYRDDLYLLGEEEVHHQEKRDFIWEERAFKISRIQDLEESEESFKYPSSSKWNPEKAYSRTSGLMKDVEQTARIKVHGPMRKMLQEKIFMNSKLIEGTKDWDIYEFIYTSESEFLGQIFVWANSLEILAPQGLRKAFVEKAQAAVDRNSLSKTLKKAA